MYILLLLGVIFLGNSLALVFKGKVVYVLRFRSFILYMYFGVFLYICISIFLYECIGRVIYGYSIFF